MNPYSDAWFETFLSPGTAPPVDREVEFFSRHVPVADYPRVLDVACGIGRHSRALADAGYRVVGIDRSEDALRIARERALAGAVFERGDMRTLDRLDGEFDVVACLWQSWGGFTESENLACLTEMRRRLRPGGRVLLDIYNREALSSLATREVAERNARRIITTRSLVGQRLRVRIEYEGCEESDEFDWQVFTPEEIDSFGRSAGLAPLFTCAWFDESTRAGPEHVRMQALFARG